jgi:hypothetical protein
MNNVIILCWQPGSCGDFVQSELLKNFSEYSGVVKRFDQDCQGRTIPIIDDFFKQNFEHSPEEWYNRSWTKDDCDLVSEHVNHANYSNFIIPTHRFDQLLILKNSIPNSKTMGVTYPKNMFPLVLKNWAKKVVPADTQINKIYDQSIHQLMKDKNIFGEFVLKEQLKHGTMVRSEVSNMFDINISLEDLFCREDLIDWLATQNQLHQYHYDLPTILKESLGYNSKATKINNIDIQLDLFDNILIQAHTNKEVPSFKFLSEATAFFSLLEDV